MARKTYLMAAVIVVLAGCVSDELVVFEQNLLGPADMESFLGTWILVNLTTGDETEITGRAEEDSASGKKTYYFKMDKEDFTFQLSRIPNSKRDLLLLSTPDIDFDDDGEKDNMFFILKRFAGDVHLWWFEKDQHVADRLVKGEEGYPADEVKAFLETSADAFTLMNKPVAILKRRGKYYSHALGAVFTITTGNGLELLSVDSKSPLLHCHRERRVRWMVPPLKPADSIVSIRGRSVTDLESLEKAEKDLQEFLKAERQRGVVRQKVDVSIKVRRRGDSDTTPIIIHMPVSG